MTTSRTGVWLAIAAALALLGLTIHLGGYPLLDPDEGRNAEVAREMAASNDYVLPQLNGLPYLDKPVLYFAAGAVMIELLGPTETAVRLPSLLFTLATLTLLVWFGRRHFGPTAGVAAGIATATTPFTLAYARTVIFDSALTLFVVMALVGFYEATTKPREDRTIPWWTALAWGAMALGVLTKGPVALAVPLLVVIPFAIWRQTLRRIIDPVSVLLFFALLGPWLLSMSRQVPGFFEHAIVTETIVRLTTDELRRAEPFWYFFPILPAAALPWTLVVLGGWRSLAGSIRTPPRDPRIVFLLLWIVAPLIFFSLSQSKRPQYILPLIPAIGLLVAAIWRCSSDRLVGGRWAAASLGALGLFLVFGHDAIRAATTPPAGVAAEIPATAWRLGSVCLLSSIVGLVRSQWKALTLAALSLPVASIPFVSQGLMDAIGRDRSARALAEVIGEATSVPTEIVGIEAFPLSLPFYLQREMTLATADGEELTSNYLIRNLEPWRRRPLSPLRPAEWWRDALQTCNRPRVFVIRSDAPARAELNAALPLLMDSGRYAAYGPCGLSDLAARPATARVIVRFGGVLRSGGG